MFSSFGEFLAKGVQAVVVCALIGCVAVWLAVRFNELLQGRLTERIVFALYVWARWWQCVAVAIDMALKHFREHKAASTIEPSFETGVGR